MAPIRRRRRPFTCRAMRWPGSPGRRCRSAKRRPCAFLSSMVPATRPGRVSTTISGRWKRRSTSARRRSTSSSPPASTIATRRTISSAPTASTSMPPATPSTRTGVATFAASSSASTISANSASPPSGSPRRWRTARASTTTATIPTTGRASTYQDLINEAHARGIRIVQDVVINHSSQYGIRGLVWIDHLPIKYYVPQGSQQGQTRNGPYTGNLGNYPSPFREDNDNPVAPDWFRQRQTTDADGTTPLSDPRAGQQVPSSGYNPNRFFGIDATTLDPTWYHQEGFIMGGDWESQHPLQARSIAGDCIDLFTENQTVRDYIIESIGRYLDMGVDALRIDTVKHIERGNLLEY